MFYWPNRKSYDLLVRLGELTLVSYLSDLVIFLTLGLFLRFIWAALPLPGFCLFLNPCAILNY